MTPTSSVPLCFASCSIGLDRHTLHQKVEAIRHAGFTSIELSMPDLVKYASLQFGRDVAEDDYEALCEAGKMVKTLCQRHNLDILVLQPFANFEGWEAGSQQREEAFERAKGWIDIMAAVGTDMLQVGSSDSVDINSSFEDLASDLGSLADLLAPFGFRIAYENWCWATRATTWKDVWKIIQMTGRHNVGLCLDTFQTAGGEWGDPTTDNGLIPGVTEDELNERYGKSLAELTATVPGDKIYFLQISDAYRMTPALRDEADPAGLRPRGQWSHDFRPLPYDGGYLPLAPFVAAVLATGFRGYFSIEVFDGRFEEKYGDDLLRFAQKAVKVNERLVEEAKELMPSLSVNISNRGRSPTQSKSAAR